MQLKIQNTTQSTQCNVILVPWMLLAIEFSSPNASSDVVLGLRETVEIYLYWQSHWADVQGVKGGSHPQNVGGLNKYINNVWTFYSVFTFSYSLATECSDLMLTTFSTSAFRSVCPILSENVINIVCLSHALENVLDFLVCSSIFLTSYDNDIN